MSESLLPTPPAITVLSYNLWYHKDAAYEGLPEAIERHGVDILCLQESQPEKLDNELGGLSLVHVTPMNPKEALATYVNKERFEAEECVSRKLARLAFERLTKKDRQRLQLTKLHDKENTDTNNRIVVGNMHAVELLARRNTRRQQAVEATQLATEFADGAPIIMTGDFNHPFAGHQLISAMQKVGLKPANDNGSPVSTYRRFLGGEFDRIFVTDDGRLDVEDFQVLAALRASDHMPIVGRLALQAPRYLAPADGLTTA